MIASHFGDNSTAVNNLPSLTDYEYRDVEFALRWYVR
jgi:hypothetical protein